METLTAALADKGSLLAQLNDAQGQLAKVSGDFAALQKEKATLEAELTAKRQELADIEAALNAAHSTAASAEERAIDITASQGVPPVKLPEGAASSAPTLDDLVARLEKEQDPKARFTLAQEIQALRWAN
jgi:septal ring factor EnvC (AmiA/AmiB activator)